MAKETIESVKRAEEQAIEILENSKVKGNELIDAAYKQKAALLASLESDAKGNALSFIEEAKLQAEKIRILSENEAVEAASLLSKTAIKNKARAIDAVVARITG